MAINFNHFLRAIIKIKPKKQFKPANNLKGQSFLEENCFKCAKYARCELCCCPCLYNVNDTEYPREWQIGKNGQPTCTAFKEKGRG